MDYIFRWLQLRFLTGQQQMLFDNLRPRTPALGPQSEGIGDLNGSSDARNELGRSDAGRTPSTAGGSGASTPPTPSPK